MTYTPLKTNQVMDTHDNIKLSWSILIAFGYITISHYLTVKCRIS